jgi:hypothetical protein
MAHFHLLLQLSTSQRAKCILQGLPWQAQRRVLFNSGLWLAGKWGVERGRGNGVLSGRVLLDKTSDWCVSCCVIVAEQLHQWVPRMCVRVLPAITQQVVISSCQQCRCEVGCCDDASQLCSRSFMQTALCCGATMWDRTGVLR